jgi:hypothetical protein
VGWEGQQQRRELAQGERSTAATCGWPGTPTGVLATIDQLQELHKSANGKLVTTALTFFEPNVRARLEVTRPMRIYYGREQGAGLQAASVRFSTP